MSVILRDSLGIKALIFFLLISIILILFIVGISSSSSSPQCEDCNIVVVSLEPLRADHMGVYGYERNTTPNIDSLAEESLVFDNAYSQSSHTFTSLVSFFTGKYAAGHGITPLEASEEDYTDELKMLPEILNQRGYTTIGATGGDNARAELGFDSGFDYFNDNPRTESDLTFLENKIRKSKDDQFFLYYQGFHMHDPYIAPPEYTELFEPNYEEFRREYWQERARLNEDTNKSGDERYRSQMEFYFSSVRENESLEEFAISEYDAMIRYGDERVGEVLELLEEEELEDDTIVIFTSMHGEMLGEHDSWRHHEHLYNEVLEVPMIISYPGADNQRLDDTVRIIDIFPTILDLIGIDHEGYKDQIQGDSIFEIMKMEIEDNRFVLAETVNLDRKVLIDTMSGYKYYKDYISEDEQVFNISQEEDKVNDSNIKVEMSILYNEFLSNVREDVEYNINASQPYLLSVD